MLAFAPTLARASPLAEPNPPSDAIVENAPRGSERLRKFALALKTLGIPAEKITDFADFPDAGRVSTSDVLGLAKYIDPDGGLRRYLDVTASRITLYPNFAVDSKGQDAPDYSVATGARSNEDSPDLIRNLGRVADQVRANRPHPLAGLRVVIDPGHMGSPFWNDKDGKFVKFGGKTVAEGELTLWTAKLLANELEALGATVLLTRTTTDPVTTYTWDDFNPSAQLANYYYKSLDDWMPKYLALSDAELVRRLPSAPEVVKMKGFSGKVYLFLQEDMNARAKIVDAFKPDVFIDLHFDSQKTDALQSSRDDVSVYVPGGIRKNETGAINQRTDGLKHLLDVRRWKQSARMDSLLVNQVAKNLGLPALKDPNAVQTAVKVSDGVYARNIYETKRMTGSLCGFFESFHYDHVREFPRLTTLDRSSIYHGHAFRYPSRLEAISTGIRQGLLTYFQSFQAD